MSRPALEVADIFRDHGSAWRSANAGHVSLDQLKVMSAIERCRTAALGGHVARCEKCSHTVIAYNSCRNRHCPKCQGAAAKQWLAEREAELLPVPYFHVVFTLPAPVVDIAHQNKAVIYDLLFKAAHQGTLDLRASPSAAERGAWARPLRRAILARTSPPCAHDDARLRLPPIPSPQTSEAGKKESTDRRLDPACRPSVTPSSRSSPDRHRSDAHTAENRSARARSVNKSAKVVLARAAFSILER